MPPLWIPSFPHAPASALLLVLCASATAPAQRQWREQAAGVVLTSASMLEVADLDGDGALDVFASASEGPWIYWNSGWASFDPQLLGPGGTLSDAAHGTVGDFDGDGDLDVFYRSQALPSALLYRNDGGRQFSPVSTSMPPTTVGYGQIESLDLDVDGDLDLVWSLTSTGLSAAFNDGTGQFSAGPALLPLVFGLPRQFAFVDPDRDGDMDVLTLSFPLGLTLFRNVGGGSFATEAIPGFTLAQRFAVGDVDGDGWDDLVVGSTVPSLANSLVRGTAGGGFGAAESLAPATAVNLHRLGDVDGDGDLDVLAVGSSEPLAVWLNDGSGGFVDVTTQRVGFGRPSSRALAVADFDLDGDVDAFVAISPLFSPAEDAVWINHDLQLAVPESVGLGASFDISCSRRPGYGSTLAVALVALGRPAALALPTPFGPALIDPVGAISLPFVSLAGVGEGTLSMSVPLDPALRGTRWTFQSLTLDILGSESPRLSRGPQLEIR